MALTQSAHLPGPGPSWEEELYEIVCLAQMFLVSTQWSFRFSVFVIHRTRKRKQNTDSTYLCHIDFFNQFRSPKLPLVLEPQSITAAGHTQFPPPGSNLGSPYSGGGASDSLCLILVHHPNSTKASSYFPPSSSSSSLTNSAAVVAIFTSQSSMLEDLPESDNEVVSDGPPPVKKKRPSLEPEEQLQERDEMTMNMKKWRKSLRVGKTGNQDQQGVVVLASPVNGGSALAIHSLSHLETEMGPKMKLLPRQSHPSDHLLQVQMGRVNLTPSMYSFSCSDITLRKCVRTNYLNSFITQQDTLTFDTSFNQPNTSDSSSASVDSDDEASSDADGTSTMSSISPVSASNSQAVNNLSSHILTNTPSISAPTPTPSPTPSAALSGSSGRGRYGKAADRHGVMAPTSRGGRGSTPRPHLTVRTGSTVSTRSGVMLSSTPTSLNPAMPRFRRKCHCTCWKDGRWCFCNENGQKAERLNGGATHTSLWRGRLNDELSCDACGLYCNECALAETPSASSGVSRRASPAGVTSPTLAPDSSTSTTPPQLNYQYPENVDFSTTQSKLMDPSGQKIMNWANSNSMNKNTSRFYQNRFGFQFPGPYHPNHLSQFVSVQDPLLFAEFDALDSTLCPISNKQRHTSTDSASEPPFLRRFLQFLH
ncbi:hypothetical protein K435DRAFT_887037 [Dendrothele bispora CBS 962.96]|uniref:GATA-type domain-containing protein n=1 Tax=Dendrothele bispora (strain CBS 962.96) TaxID=1314807 RepID=A0A4S8KSF8_DENBC|nr:hypothetical protein K435DRAFT_887037 [Dendrothele bispora CBS 962.96]